MATGTSPVQQKKSKENPAPIRARAFFGFRRRERYILNAFDNVGGMVTGPPGLGRERLVATGGRHRPCARRSAS